MLARMHAAQTLAFAALGLAEGVRSTSVDGFAGCCVSAGEEWGATWLPDAAANTASASKLKTIRNFCKVEEKTRSLMGIVPAIIARMEFRHVPCHVLTDIGRGPVGRGRIETE